MSRIFWDTMLLIYLLEGHEESRVRVEELLARSRRRGDSLFTSYLSLGEVMAGIEDSQYAVKSATIRSALAEIGFSFLPFDSGAVEPFSRVRARGKVKSADAIQLACAASAGVDLFLTGDKQLQKLDVPGIQFIADFSSEIL